MYKCKLQIESLYRKLSAEDGINFKDLAELLAKLARALNNKSKTFTLTKIESSSYSPTLETLEEDAADEFDLIHRAIGTTEVERLPDEYQEYAVALNKLLFANNLYLTATSRDETEGIKITQVLRLSSNQYYYSIKSIRGKIVTLHGRDELKPYIAVQNSKGITQTVFIQNKDEKALSALYKDLNVNLRVRAKIDIKDSKVLRADLIDYTISSDGGFLSTIKRVQDQYGDIFQHIKDSAERLKDVRGAYE